MIKLIQSLAMTTVLCLTATSVCALSAEKQTKSTSLEPQPAEIHLELEGKAAGGNAMAQAELGAWYYFRKKDYPEAFKWMFLAAQQGHVQAEFNVGVMYQTGRGVERDTSEALKWYRKAAAEGLAEAQNNMGIIYYHGWGVPRDNVEASKWYRMAAEQGDRMAQNNLGMMYDDEQTEPEEYSVAFAKATKQRFASSQYDLGFIYSHGISRDEDLDEAAGWYRKASEGGHTWAQFDLAKLCLRKIGEDPQALAEACRWWRLAAEGGHNEAQSVGLSVILGEMGLYFKRKQEPVPECLNDMIEWLKKEGETGRPWAQINLGMIYANGKAVPQDFVEAYKWFTIVASPGQRTEQSQGALPHKAALDLPLLGTAREKQIAKMLSSRGDGYIKTIERSMTPEQIAEGKRRAALTNSNTK